MAPYRRRLGQLVLRWAGSGGGLAGGNDAERTGDKIWIGTVVLTIVGSLALIALAPSAVVQVSIGVIWGCVIGSGFLLYLPATTIHTLFGGFLGIGLTDLAGLSGAVEQSSKGLERLMMALTEGAVQIKIMPLAYWLFIGLVLLFCLPAYRRVDTK